MKVNTADPLSYMALPGQDETLANLKNQKRGVGFSCCHRIQKCAASACETIIGIAAIAAAAWSLYIPINEWNLCVTKQKACTSRDLIDVQVCAVIEIVMYISVACIVVCCGLPNRKSHLNHAQRNAKKKLAGVILE